ncbi:MAG: hypothetical protein ACOYJE_01915 [Bacteroidaceae bacterium]|jgi:hypothetical protein
MKLLPLLLPMLLLLTACPAARHHNRPQSTSQPDSICIEGQADTAFLRTAGSAVLTVCPLAAPLNAAQPSGSDGTPLRFPLTKDGHFTAVFPQDCPTLCLVTIGTGSSSPLDTSGVFFLNPGDTLHIQASWDGKRLAPDYRGATPRIPLADFRRAKDFFDRHADSFDSYTLPAERDQLLLRLDSLHKARIRLRLAAEADIYLQLQLNTAALVRLASAHDVPDGYFSFLEYMDLGNPLVYSTRNCLTAFRNLLANPYFRLPDPQTLTPDDWQDQARKALDPFIHSPNRLFYPLLYEIARLKPAP